MRAQYPQMFNAAIGVLLLLLLLAVPVNGVTLLERISRSTRAVFSGAAGGYGVPPAVKPLDPMTPKGGTP